MCKLTSFTSFHWFWKASEENALFSFQNRRKRKNSFHDVLYLLLLYLLLCLLLYLLLVINIFITLLRTLLYLTLLKWDLTRVNGTSTLRIDGIPFQMKCIYIIYIYKWSVYTRIVDTDTMRELSLGICVCGENENYLPYSCPRDWCLSAS